MDKNVLVRLCNILSRPAATKKEAEAQLCSWITLDFWPCPSTYARLGLLRGA